MASQAKPVSSWKIPKKGEWANEEDGGRLYDFMLRGTDRETQRYLELDTDVLTATAYCENNQWIDRQRHEGSRRAPHIRQLEGSGWVSKEGIPMPIQNEIIACVENEEARLGKRNSEVFCEPSDAGNPSAKAGAKVAQDYLVHHFDEIKWSRTRKRAIERLVRTGTMILRSWMDWDNLDTVRIGLEQGCVRCAGMPEMPPVMDPMTGIEMPGAPAQPPCDYMLASSEIPMSDEEFLGMDPQRKAGISRKASFDFKAENPDSPIGRGKGKTTYTATACECGSPLKPFVPSPEEANLSDPYGRPMGKDVPKGCARIDSVSVLEFHPQNEGIHLALDEIEEVFEAAPRSIDWIKRHYTKNTHLVVPDDPKDIAEAFPDHGAELRTGSDRNLYPNHVVWRQFVKQPSMDFPKGRLIVMAGRVCVLDDDLMVNGLPLPDGRPGKPIPKVKYALARCFTKENDTFGIGFPHYVIGAQNRINMIGSQTVDMRERHGSSGIMATRGMKFLMGWLENFAGRFAIWEPDPLVPTLTPQLIDTKLMDPGAQAETEQQIEHMQRALGTMDAEIGNVPKGVSAYSAIALLGEKASERRGPREREVIDAFEDIFSHQLQLIQRYYRQGDGRDYRVKSENGWAKREFYGAMINGEVGIRVREQPSYDKPTAEREALANQMANPVFQAAFSTPYGQREAAKILGLPTDVMNQQNVQMEAVQRKWFAFLRDKKIPVIDRNLDDHFLHYSEYGRLFLSGEGVAKSEEADWDQILRAISGWQLMLPQVTALIEQAQQAGQTPAQFVQVQMSTPPMPQQVGVDPMGNPMMAPGIPYQPPPIVAKGVQLGLGMPPEPLEEAIAWLWTVLCKSRAVEVAGDPPSKEAPGALWLRMRAVYEAHNMIATQDKMTAAAGGQVLQDPGGGGTPQGTEPVPGQPAAPAPGAGPAMPAMAA